MCQSLVPAPELSRAPHLHAGGDMVRQLQSENAQSESEKKRKKLQKALRQIDDLKEKAQQVCNPSPHPSPHPNPTPTPYP